jgi:hypothetical protein
VVQDIYIYKKDEKQTIIIIKKVATW